MSLYWGDGAIQVVPPANEFCMLLVRYPYQIISSLGGATEDQRFDIPFNLACESTKAYAETLLERARDPSGRMEPLAL